MLKIVKIGSSLSSHFKTNSKSKDKVIQSILSHSFVANTIDPKSLLNTKQPWYSNSRDYVYTQVTVGKQFVDTFHPKTKEFHQYIVTPNKIFKGDKEITTVSNEEHAFIVEPGLLYRFVTGNQGAGTISVKVHKRIPLVYDESITPFEVEYEDEGEKERTNKVSIYNVCDKEEIEKLGEYADNDEDVMKHHEFEKLCKRWNDSAFLI